MIKSWAWDGQKYFQKLKRLSIPVELFRNFLCLFLRQLWYPSNYIFYRCINFTPFQQSSPRETGPDSFGSRKWSAYQLSLDLQSSVMKKIGATFLWSLSIFYSNMLKNSSQTIFLAHYYHINLENTPQLNFRIMLFLKGQCPFLKILDTIR